MNICYINTFLFKFIIIIDNIVFTVWIKKKKNSMWKNFFFFLCIFFKWLKKFIETLTNCIKEFKGLIKILTKLIITLTLVGIIVGIHSNSFLLSKKYTPFFIPRYVNDRGGGSN
jgi:hypothetical protein